MALASYSKKTFRVSKDQVSSNLGDEAVILNHKKGEYFGLNPTGAYIWNFIQKPKCFEEICGAVAKEYGIEAVRAEKDVAKLLTDMLKQGLVETK